MEARRLKTAALIDSWKPKSVLTTYGSESMGGWLSVLRGTKELKEVAANVFDDGLVLRRGLPFVAMVSHNEGKGPIIYRTKTGKRENSEAFADLCHFAGVDMVILQFSIWERNQRGLYARDLRKRGIEVAMDGVSYSSKPGTTIQQENEVLLRTYEEAADRGIRFFVVTGKQKLAHGLPDMEEALMQTWRNQPIFFLQGMDNSPDYMTAFSKRNNADNWHLLMSEHIPGNSPIGQRVEARVAALDRPVTGDYVY